jgi:superfamily II DNA or RNA helicase
VKELRPYQEDALQAIRQTVGQGVKRLVCQSPTGSGKTLLAATIVDGALRKGNRLCFTVPAIDLVDQTVEMFYAQGIKDVGVIQADHRMTNWQMPIQVASIQTIRSRGIYPEAQVVVIDECHQLHKAHVKWLSDPDWQAVPFIGLSATPWTRGLGKHFSSLLVMSTTKELIEEGYLSRFRVFAADHPDLSNVPTMGKTGDYKEAPLSTVMSQQQLMANVIETWRVRHNADKTLCFAVDRAHAKSLQERFLDAGISCAYQDANTPSAERAEIKRRFHSGDYRVVCSVGTLCTGVDWDVRCLVLARPTKSEMLYVQIIGRGLRTAEGKTHLLVLDHTSTTERLGLVTDVHHDSLSMGKLDENKAAPRKPPLPRPCPQCSCLMAVGVRVCEECGFERKIVSKVTERDGQLVEFDGTFRKKGKTDPKLLPYSFAEKIKYFQQLRGYEVMRGYRKGWAANQFREKFNEGWPPWSWNDLAPMAPGPEVTSWIKSRLIAWAQSKARTASAAAGTPRSDSGNTQRSSYSGAKPAVAGDETTPPWE